MSVLALTQWSLGLRSPVAAAVIRTVESSEHAEIGHQGNYQFAFNVDNRISEKLVHNQVTDCSQFSKGIRIQRRR